jgi:hypothetical protein
MSATRKLTKAEIKYERETGRSSYRPPPLRTEYDQPIPEDSDESVDLGLALLAGVEQLRLRAIEVLGEMAFGDSGGATEEDDEELFSRAGHLNREADLIVAECHRRVRAHWLAARPGGPLSRKGARQ